jgi:hypothetical protein
MTGLRTSTWIWASAGTVALMGAMAACSLNPQPLPPDTPYDAGASGAAADGSGLSLAPDGGALFRPDAGATMPATGGGDASAAASRDAGTTDGGSAIDGGSSDAAIDAEDGEVPADSTTDAAADGSADAPIDADDAPGEAD